MPTRPWHRSICRGRDEAELHLKARESKCAPEVTWLLGRMKPFPRGTLAGSRGPRKDGFETEQNGRAGPLSPALSCRGRGSVIFFES